MRNKIEGEKGRRCDGSRSRLVVGVSRGESKRHHHGQGRSGKDRRGCPPPGGNPRADYLNKPQVKPRNSGEAMVIGKKVALRDGIRASPISTEKEQRGKKKKTVFSGLMQVGGGGSRFQSKSRARVKKIYLEGNRHLGQLTGGKEAWDHYLFKASKGGGD